MSEWDGFMFPKEGKKKKRRKHPKSILHCKDGTCYLCMKLKGYYGTYPVVHEHHVWPGKPNKKISEDNGFKVYLCPEHHEFSEEAVHDDYGYMRMIQQDCQREYEKTHSRQQFMNLLKRNYLDS